MPRSGADHLTHVHGGVSLGRFAVRWCTASSRMNRRSSTFAEVDGFMRGSPVSSVAVDQLISSVGIVLGQEHATVQLVRVTCIGYFVEHGNRVEEYRQVN